MWTLRAADDEDPSALDPIFRPICFADEQEVVRMTILLRDAWRQVEPPDVNDEETASAWLRDLSSRYSDGIAATATDDNDAIDTPVKLELIKFWKHVHSEVIRFLDGATPYCGSMGEQTCLVVRFNREIRSGAALVSNHAFGSNVLLIPAFVAPGTQIRITRNRQNPEMGREADVGTFELDKNPYGIYYLRRGFEFNFYTNAQGNIGDREVAAVFSICTLNTEEGRDGGST